MYPLNHVINVFINVVVNGAEFELIQRIWKVPSAILLQRNPRQSSCWHHALRELRTKAICDTLTSTVFASKPTLEQSFDNTADVLSDERLRGFVSQRGDLQSNRYLLTKEQWLRYNWIGDRLGRVLSEPSDSPFRPFCSELGRVRT